MREMFKLKIFKFLLLMSIENCICNHYCDGENNLCINSDSVDFSHWSHSSHRFLLYDVNPGEGFNLRRDVYMRVASLVKKLNMKSSPSYWILVLPPWGPLYHWKSEDLGYQAQIKWSNFFDIPSLESYVPVIELEDFLRDHVPDIDVVYYLQHYVEGWEDNSWIERIDIRDCIGTPPYDTVGEVVKGWFWGYEEIIAKKFHCVSLQGYSNTLTNFLLSSNSSVVMVDRAEVMLHDQFGDLEYWKIRQSMVFSKHLIQIGNRFMKQHLNFTFSENKLSLRLERKATGGPFIGVHLRRADFARSRSADVPSIKHAAYQILEKMKELNLEMLFVATDSTMKEFEELKTYIPGAKRFLPGKKVRQDILDGGVAIVDQWICSHARFFIGTYESTFSFRIQEEREILGFPTETTFNRLCGDNQTLCTQPSKWKIVWP